MFNDLKPDNIVLGVTEEDLSTANPDDNCFKNTKIRLVDFDFATKYMDDNGELKEKEKVERFRGNLIFGSAS